MPFTGNVANLQKEISFERNALEFVRGVLYDRSEDANDRVVIYLSEGKLDSGHYRTEVVHSGVVELSDSAVSSALSKLRPLVFTATLKMHDLIVEWILRANGFKGGTFQTKVADYKARKSSGALLEPAVLADWARGSDAFWALYEELTRLRNTITHSGAFLVTEDALSIKGGVALRRTDQMAYVRAICLIADCILRRSPVDDVCRSIISADFERLTSVHKVFGFSKSGVQVVSVELVTRADVEQGNFCVTVDFDEIREQVEQTFPADTNCRIFYDLTIHAVINGRQQNWGFPPDAVPSGTRCFSGNDTEFAPYYLGERLIA
ncbi:MAG: hypothetical protein FWD68_06980 [Alphaproteobacteria bacterium]|nr:hypothetical protein [Alphaproteobacteria bacterium]